jgi:hypothetical protein
MVAFSRRFLPHGLAARFLQNQAEPLLNFQRCLGDPRADSGCHRSPKNDSFVSSVKLIALDPELYLRHNDADRPIADQCVRLHPAPRTRRAEVFPQGLQAGASGLRLWRMRRRGSRQRHRARCVLGATEEKGDRCRKDGFSGSRGGRSGWRARFKLSRSSTGIPPPKSASDCAGGNRCRYWLSCRRSFSAGPSSGCPNIPWPRLRPLVSGRS